MVKLSQGFTILGFSTSHKAKKMTNAKLHQCGIVQKKQKGSYRPRQEYNCTLFFCFNNQVWKKWTFKVIKVFFFFLLLISDGNLLNQVVHSSHESYALFLKRKVEILYARNNVQNNIQSLYLEKNILKIDPTVLFTHLKIILLQYF